MVRSVALGSLALLLLPAARADDIASGPDRGDTVPALRVYDATGLHKDRTVDYAAERKDKPTVFILLRADKFDRPMNRFLKTLDQKVKKDHEGVYVVAVWLTEDLDRTRKLLPRVQQSVQYEATALTCVAADREGPRDWNVNGDAHLTVVVADRNKVTATFAFISLNETDVPAVTRALKKSPR
jgi:hypothetical protein